MSIQSGFRSPYPVPISAYLKETIPGVDAVLTEALQDDPIALATASFGVPQALAAGAAQRPAWAVALLSQLSAQKNWKSRRTGRPSCRGSHGRWLKIDKALLREVAAMFVSLADELDGRVELGRCFHLSASSSTRWSDCLSWTSPMLHDLEALGARVSAAISMGRTMRLAWIPSASSDHAYNSWSWLAGSFLDRCGLHSGAAQEGHLVWPVEPRERGI